MHHWDDRDRGLATLVGALTPGGRLLLAERALKSPGHGITADQAEAVQQVLTSLGQTEVKAVEHAVGRRRMTIIVSSRPTG